MEIFRLFGSIFVENDKANKALDTTDAKSKGLAGTLGSVIGTAAKVGAAIVGAASAAGAALYAVTSRAGEATDRIDKMSQKIGLSRQGFQEWDFILSQNGTSIESLQTGLKTLVQRMDEAASGTGKGGELFRRLGVSAVDATGKLRNQEAVFRDMVRALQAMPDGAEKARLATELFGRSGQELMPLLNGAAGGVDELMQKAHELGLVLSDETVDAGVKFQGTMDQAKRAVGSVFTQVGVALMPMFQKLAEWIFTHMPEIKAVVSEVFGTIGKAVMWLVDNVIPLLTKAWQWMSDNVIPLLQQFWAVIQELWDRYGESILLALRNTWEQISTILETAFGVVRGIFDFFLSVLRGDWEGAWNAIKGIVETVWTGIRDFFGVIWEQIKTAFKGPIDVVTGWIQGFLGWVETLIGKVKGAIDWVKNLLGLNREAVNTMPEAPETGVAVRAAEVPEFALGGVVPGPVGEPRLAVVHGGEEVLTPEQRAAQGTDITEIVMYNTFIVPDKAVGDYVAGSIARQLRNRAVTV